MLVFLIRLTILFRNARSCEQIGVHLMAVDDLVTCELIGKLKIVSLNK